MKTDHKDLNEYMLWLVSQCAIHFDNDQDLIDCKIKVSEDVLMEANTLKRVAKRSSDKKSMLKAIESMLYANHQLMQIAPGLVFCQAALICAWRWVYDNM